MFGVLYGWIDIAIQATNLALLFFIVREGLWWLKKLVESHSKDREFYSEMQKEDRDASREIASQLLLHLDSELNNLKESSEERNKSMSNSLEVLRETYVKGIKENMEEQVKKNLSIEARLRAQIEDVRNLVISLKADMHDNDKKQSN